MAGRVPVKVTLESGPIRIGDYPMSCSKPGYAMKATQPGPTVGQALEAFDGSHGSEGKVLCFVKVGENAAVYRERLDDLGRKYERLEQELGELKAQLRGEPRGGSNGKSSWGLHAKRWKPRWIVRSRSYRGMEISV